MEGIVILLILGAVFCVFVLPILTSAKAGRAERQAQELASRVADLESRLAALAGQVRANQGRTVLPAVQKADRIAEETSTGAEPVAAPMPPPPPPPVIEAATPGETDDFLDRLERARARVRDGRVYPDAEEEEPAGPLPAPQQEQAGSPPPIPPTRPESASEEKPAISLEQFMGVKLFAWLGGVAMFFGVIFFVKYAFERNLIPPAVRVALGFVTGAGLLAGGMATHRREAYRVLAQAFCATGVLILYGVSYAAHAVYHFPAFGPWMTFGLMALITAAGILIAVRLDAAVVAVLGMIGGFLAPILLPSVQDNTFALAGYIALLDIGLLAVAGRGRWPALAAGAALGTAITQIAWFAQFFSHGRYHEGTLTYVPMGLALGFIALFLAAAWMTRKSEDNRADAAAGAGLFLTGLATVFAFLCLTYPAITDRPFLLYGFVFALNAALMAAMWMCPAFSRLYPLAPGITFLHLGLWTAWRLKPDLFGSALAVFLGFGAAHACLPLLWRRIRPAAAPASLLGAAPWLPLAPLLLTLTAVLALPHTSWLLWPAVLLVDLLALAVAAATGTVMAVPVALVLSLVVAGAWLIGEPADAAPLPILLGMILAFAGIFSAAGGWLVRRAAANPARGEAAAAALLPACSGAMPFALLILALLRLPVQNPSPVFGVALLLVLLLLGLAVLARQAALPLVALACTLALEACWHAKHFTPGAPWIPLGWYLGFYLLFTLFPFVFRRRLGDRIDPWVAGALSGIVHFPLVHDLVRKAFPNDMMGLLPLAFAMPALLALVAVIRCVPTETREQRSRLAWFGGAALFFITLIFPIQFDRQWLTVSWALEGAALVWLFRRVPHPGLKLTGLALLAVAFARLALNPAVFTAYPRGGTPILNWHLYAYGVVALAMFAAARCLPEAHRRIGGTDAKPVLCGFGGVLLFLLLNIEIADFFTEEGQRFVAFRFGGNFARDMTYSIAWGLFSLCLLVLGIVRRAKGARYAAIALLALTLLKLFVHDLSAIDNIFRIGALLGVAVIAFIASFLYQRFFSQPGKP